METTKQYKTGFKHAGIEWDVLLESPSSPYMREYCADGDGFVRVCQRAKGCFKGFLVFDQLDYITKHDTLEDALDHAVQILKTNYSEIYDKYYEGESA